MAHEHEILSWRRVEAPVLAIVPIVASYNELHNISHKKKLALKISCLVELIHMIEHIHLFVLIDKKENKISLYIVLASIRILWLGSS